MIARTPQYLCAAKNGHLTNETPLQLNSPGAGQARQPTLTMHWTNLIPQWLSVHG